MIHVIITKPHSTNYLWDSEIVIQADSAEAAIKAIKTVYKALNETDNKEEDK